MKVKRTKKGFTLIELISVVAIILILALIALPSLKGYKDKATTSKAVASSKILLNAIETYNVESGGNIGENGNKADTIEPTHKVLQILDKEHNYVDSYISEEEQVNLRKIMSSDLTVEQLRNFVTNNGKSEKVYLAGDGKISASTDWKTQKNN